MLSLKLMELKNDYYDFNKSTPFLESCKKGDLNVDFFEKKNNISMIELKNGFLWACINLKEDVCSLLKTKIESFKYSSEYCFFLEKCTLQSFLMFLSYETLENKDLFIKDAMNFSLLRSSAPIFHHLFSNYKFNFEENDFRLVKLIFACKDISIFRHFMNKMSKSYLEYENYHLFKLLCKNHQIEKIKYILYNYTIDKNVLIEMMEYANEKGHSLLYNMLFIAEGYKEEHLEKAIKNNHFYIINSLLKNNIPFDYEKAFKLSCEHGSKNCIKNLFNFDYKINWDECFFNVMKKCDIKFTISFFQTCPPLDLSYNSYQKLYLCCRSNEYLPLFVLFCEKYSFDFSMNDNLLIRYALHNNSFNIFLEILKRHSRINIRACDDALFKIACKNNFHEIALILTKIVPEYCVIMLNETQIFDYSISKENPNKKRRI